MDLEITKPGTPKCLVCLGDVGESMSDINPWQAPGGALVFVDTGSFGSRINDSACNGTPWQILVCDECLEARRSLIQEYKVPGHDEARRAQSRQIFSDPTFRERMDDNLEELKVRIAQTRSIVEKHARGGSLTEREIAVMQREYGDDWRTESLKPKEPELTPEERTIVHQNEIARLRRLREERMLSMAQSVLDGNDSVENFIDENLRWGTKGISGTEPLKYVRLKDCETDHLHAILKSKFISGLYRRTIEHILAERAQVA